MRRGQALPFLLVAMTSILALLFAGVRIAHLGAEKVAAANAVDAVALSAATCEARGLNTIAALNDGILQCTRVIRYVSAVWAALAVSAAFGVGVPAFTAYTRYAQATIRNCWNCARELSRWSEQVRRATPCLVLAEAQTLAVRRNVRGVLSPADPRGPHDGAGTLELHLRPGEPLTLAEAMSPIFAFRKKLSKSPLASTAQKSVARILDPVLGAFVGAAGPPIRLLVPEEDFERRQHVRFSGVRPAPALPVPSVFPGHEGVRFPFASFAEPYGGTATEMTWRSRLVVEKENAP